MADIRTKIALEYEAKGLSKAQSEMGKLHKTNQKAIEEQIKGTKSNTAEIKNLRNELKDLARQQLAVSRVMEETGDKGSDAYKELTKEMDRLKRSSTDAERILKQLQRAIKDTAVTAKDLAKGGFTQGVMQGVGAAPFMQRGPGMMRQAAGLATGRAARGLGMGAAMSPFAGLGSLVSGLSSIPGGGMIAAPLQTAMAQSQQQLGFQQQMLQLSPLMGGAVGQIQAARRGFRGEDVGAVGQAARAGVSLTPEVRERIARDTQVVAAGQRRTALREAGLSASPGLFQSMDERTRRAQIMNDPRFESRFERVATEGELRRTRDAAQRAEETAATQRNAQGRARAGAAARRRFMAPITGAGTELLAGGAPEAMNVAAGITRAGGGTIDQMGRRFTRTAFGARTAFGIDEQTSGAFMQAGRVGGLVGVEAGGRRGMNQAADSMTEAMNDGIKLGLKGSELQDYMRQVAEGITAWRTTGIPFNKDSIGELSGQMATSLGGVRGAVTGQAIGRMVQGVAGPGGIRGAGDLQILRTLGGFQMGSGAEGLKQARIKLEELTGPGGKGIEDALPDLFKQFLGAGGGGAVGEGVLQNFLAQRGVKLSTREVDILAKQSRGETLGKDDQAFLKQRKSERAREADVLATSDPVALARRAAESVDVLAPNVKRHAKLVNQQINTGGILLNSMQDMEREQNKIAATMANTMRPAIDGVTKGAQQIAELLPELIARIENAINVLGKWI